MTSPLIGIKSLVGLCAFLLLIRGAAAYVDGNQSRGVIQNIDSTRIVLATKARELTFQITAKTKISLNEKPASSMDLKAGDTATVTAQGTEATAIDAQRGDSPKTPDPPRYEVREL